jgi:outer membrane autotransporter protein
MDRLPFCSFRVRGGILSALITSAIFSPAYAGDWQIGDYQSDDKRISHGDIWQGNASLGQQSYGEVFLEQGSRWDGDLLGTADRQNPWDSGQFYINLTDDSIWNGNVSGVVNVMLESQNSKIAGNMDIYGQIAANLTATRYQGNITVNADNNYHGAINLILTDASQWLGNVSASYSSLEVGLESGSIWTGEVEGYNAGVEIKVGADAILRGSITNVLDDPGAGGNHRIEIKLGGQWLGDSTLRIDATNSPFVQKTITVENDSHWVGNAVLQIDNASGWDSYATIRVTEGSSWQGDFTLAGQGFSHIQIDNDAFWQGNLILDDFIVGYQPGYVLINNSQWQGYVKGSIEDTDVLLSDAQWTMTGDSWLNTLQLGGVSDIVSFDSNNGGLNGYHTLTINQLDGYGHFIMRAGYYGAGLYGNDKLVILKDKNVTGGMAADSLVTILNNGSDNTHGTETIVMIETADGLDRFTATGDVELGGYVYTLEQDGTDWILRPGAKGSSWQPVISNPADAAANSMNAYYLITYAERQALYQRMGDLRQSGQDGDVWLRSYHGGFDKLSGGLMNGFDMSYSGIQLGADKKQTLNESELFIGVMMGLTEGSQRYLTGDGTLKSKHIGVYASYLSSGGFYVDGLIKYNDLKNSFSVADTMAFNVSGSGRSKGISASLEAGKRFYLSSRQQGMYGEPQLQFSWSYQDDSRLNLSNGLAVKTDSYTSTVGRIGAQIGYTTGSAVTPANVYVKSSYLKEFDGNVGYSLNDSRQRHAFKGDWWLNGVGFSVQVKDHHHVYVDMEKSNGNSFNQHQVNLGYRLGF